MCVYNIYIYIYIYIYTVTPVFAPVVTSYNVHTLYIYI